MDTLLNDLRFAFRGLRKSPGFTLVAVLTLALGIGANTAIFSVVQGVVLAPLPYRQPDRLVDVWLYNRALKYITDLSYPDFLDWQRTARSVEQMAAFSPQDYDLTSPGTAEHLNGQQVSAGFFATLGTKLTLGREFTPEEDRYGGAAGVVISDRLWKSRFAGSAAALGKSVALGGVDYTVVGVLAPGFRFGDQPADVYTPIGQRDPLMNDRAIHDNGCVARLKPGVSREQAQAEMDTIQEHIDQLYPKVERGQGTTVLSLRRDVVGDVQGTLLMLLGAVGIVLLIACANVANLLLTRAARRVREFAIRAALGASRAQIVRQLLTESLLLSLIGGALGLAIAKSAVRIVLATLPGTLPRSENIGLNPSVLLFTLGVSIAVGILFGLAPALRSSRPDLQSALSQGGRGSSSAHYRTQNSLVIGQVALTLVLLVGAGLLLRTIHHLWSVNPGFEVQHTVTFKVGLSAAMIKTPADTRVAYQQLLERIRRIPGVEAADLTALVPLSQQDNSGPFWFGSQPPASMAEAPRALYYWIGPDYLQTMKIPLLRGRFFAAQDTLSSEPVIIIDSVFAHEYFPNSDPVGQTVTVAHWGPTRIIGVVGHVHHWNLGNVGPYGQRQIYASFYQLPDKWVPAFRDGLTVVVRTPLDTAAIMPAIRQAVYGAGNDQPVYALQTMQQLVAGSMTSQRLSMILLATFAGLALLLASVGIYGVISYSMTQRVHEIGIRMALGAEKGNIFRLVIGNGLRLAAAGVIIGAATALLLGRLLSSFSQLLYQVRASDPLTFISVSLLLTAVAVLACYVPARGAAKVDPMTALRCD